VLQAVTKCYKKIVKSMQFLYKLDTTSRKEVCPKCNKKTFVLYKNVTNSEYANSAFGRCDREVNCGFQNYPKTDSLFTEIHAKKIVKKQSKIYLNNSLLQATFQGYKQNEFITGLLTKFDTSSIKKIVSLYKIGTVTNGSRCGGCTFPFIDSLNNIHAIQVKGFDERIKTTYTDSLGSIAYREPENYPNESLYELNVYNTQESKYECLFGEHLVNKYPISKIYLFESPKNAIIASLCLDMPPQELICLSTFNFSSFTLSRLKALRNRQVIIYPDTSKESMCFNTWKEKAEQFQRILSGKTFLR